MYAVYSFHHGNYKGLIFTLPTVSFADINFSAYCISFILIPLTIFPSSIIKYHQSMKVAAKTASVV